MKPPLIAFLVFGCSSAAFGAESLADTARTLFDAKRFPEARVALEQLVVAEPNNAEAHFFLGIAALKTNDVDEGIRQLELATTLAPTNATYVLELGGAYGAKAQKAGLLSKMGWAKKCQAALEKAVELEPDNLVARNGLISYYRAAPSFVGGGMSKAYEQAGEILKRDVAMGSAILGQLYISEKKYDDAIRVFEEGITSKPDNHQLHYLIGRSAVESGSHLDRGEQALRRCLELTPERNRPGQPQVHWRLGMIAEKRGDLAAARASYEKSLNLDSNFKEARESLAKLPAP